MFDFDYEIIGSGILGTLPCGEQRMYASVSEYEQAYTDEENDFIDGLAELEEDKIIDWPEDWCA